MLDHCWPYWVTSAWWRDPEQYYDSGMPLDNKVSVLAVVWKRETAYNVGKHPRHADGDLHVRLALTHMHSGVIL